MEIILHVHHAEVSDAMRQRAERAVRRLAARLAHTVDAVVRFEQDGRERRVELEVRAARVRPLVASGCAGAFGPALTRAVDRLEREVREQHARATRQRRAARRSVAA